MTSIFSGVRYYVIDCKDKELVDELRSHGALKHPILSDSIKFAISDDGNANEVGEAEDLYTVPVVTSQWVRFSLSANCFLPFSPFHPNFSKIFHGVIAVISEVSLKDTITLTAHLTIRGANCQTVLNESVTHLILGRAYGPFYDNCKARLPNVKIVSPDWITECIKAQKLIECEKFAVDLLIKPSVSKPPILPKPVVTTSQQIDQPPQKPTPTTLLPQPLGGIGVSYPSISPSLDNSSVSLSSRIISANTGLIGFASAQLPVSQTQLPATFQQPIHHPPDPKPTKSSGKAKTNKRPSEQGLNEEQKHAIVMQNVKNILSQQANWNKDNSQNRCDPGICQLPGNFLPTGSTPILTGGAQRKPKSPKSPGNRCPGQVSGFGGGALICKPGCNSQKSPKGGMRKTEPPEIAVAPIATAGQQPQQQQQQFTAVAVEAAGGAGQMFSNSAAATVLVAAANPGVQQITSDPRVTPVTQQTGVSGHASAFLLQQQQQFQQQSLIAQGQLQKTQAATIGSQQQLQMSPVLLQGTQSAPTQSRTTTFIVRAPSATEIQLGQSTSTTESVHALLEGGSNKEGSVPQCVTTTGSQQVFLQPGQPSHHLVQLQQQQNHVSAPTGGMLSPVLIQSRHPQPHQYKQQQQQQPGQIQMQVPCLQPQQQQIIRPQLPRANQGVRQNMPLNHQGQQQYTQLTQHMKIHHHHQQQQQQSHQLGQQIIIQTSAGVQQVVTAQDLGNAQYIGTAGAQMRAVGSSNANQCLSPRPPGLISSPTYSQSQQTMTSNGSTSSVLFQGSLAAASGVSADIISANIAQQERVTYITSVQQQQQTHSVGGRLQQTMSHGQQHQTLIGVTDARSGSVVSGQPCIIQTQHKPQQAVAIQQGQLYSSQPQSQMQQQQRLFVQSPHKLGSGQQMTPPQQQITTPQGPLQAQLQQLQLPQGGNFIQQQRQLIPQSQTHQLSPGLLPQNSRATVAQLVAGSGRTPVASASQIRQLMAATAVQQRHMVPPPPQYRGVAPVRAPNIAVATTYNQSPARAAAVVTQQSTALVGSQAVPQAAPPIFQMPAFRGHIGFPRLTTPKDCLIGCVMLLLGYHSFSESQRSMWKKIMRSYGAELVSTYDPARVTHIIVDWQLEQPDLIKQALRDKKRVVTIYWVNDVLARGTMIPPFEILHLPSPFSPDVTFSFIRSQVISITGFEGVERQKVELIIKQIGASFTDYLDQMNTLLICKRPQGKKYEMASLWGIPCVNLRWLQNLYLGDLSAIAADIAHKYLCFDASDVTAALELRTPNVQELMVGWQQGICLTEDSWKHLAKLLDELQQEEEAEEAVNQSVNRKNENGACDENDQNKKCILPKLTVEEVELAKTCQLREALLRQEGQLAAAHRAAASSVHNPAQPIVPTPYLMLTSVPTIHLPNVPSACNQQCGVAISTVTSSGGFQPPVTAPTPAKEGQGETPLVPTDEKEVEHQTLKRPHSPDCMTSELTRPCKRPLRDDLSPPKSVPPCPLATFNDEIPRPASASLISTTALPAPTVQPELPPTKAVETPLRTTLDTTLEPQLQPKVASTLQQANQESQIIPLSKPEDLVVDTEVRLLFTGVDVEVRLAVLQLLDQMPKTCIAPYRLVDSVRDATHVIADRLVRTPKIYMAVALGRAIVSPKWVQACVVRGDWIAETEWILKDAEAEENLGINLAESLQISHRRRLLDEPGLFNELEFWFSPRAYHREVCEQLVRICGGHMRERRPTQKMALLSTPKQVIICHEDEANVASYLMRTKTGNRAVHHEEFILSGVLRQELDFNSYQIQYVSSQFADLQAAISGACTNLASSGPPLPPRPVMYQQKPSVAQPVQMRPPPPLPTTSAPPPCVLLVSGSESQQPPVMYYFSSGSTISSASRKVSSSAVAVREEPLTLHLPEGVSAVVLTGSEPGVGGALALDDGLNAARVAAADAHSVASATAALATTHNPTLIAKMEATDTSVVSISPRNPANVDPYHLPPHSGSVT